MRRKLIDALCALGVAYALLLMFKLWYLGMNGVSWWTIFIPGYPWGIR